MRKRTKTLGSAKLIEVARISYLNAYFFYWRDQHGKWYVSKRYSNRIENWPQKRLTARQIVVYLLTGFTK